MTRENVYEKLTRIFRENFDDDSIELHDAMTSMDIEDWDSLEQINLVVAIQEEFGVKFNINEVNVMENVGEMVDLILRKIEI